MLEETYWLQVNEICHTLVGKHQQVVAYIFTQYSEEDGDKIIIWNAEIEEESIGEFISLFQAKLHIQRLIAEFDDREAAEALKKTTKRKTKAKAKKVAVKKTK